MIRLRALAVVLAAACAPTFATTKTPSGEACADMVVLPAGAEIRRPYHRLGPVASECPTQLEAVMLETLRRKACALRADAVIEAAREELHEGCMVASGTAVVWTK